MCKIYRARKVSLIVIWPSFENKMAVTSHVKWDYPIKKALYPLSLLLGVPDVKTTTKITKKLQNYYKGHISPLVLHYY